MQKSSYHLHTNTLGIFDGQCSSQEMIQKAIDVGYTEMGISNHLIYHPKFEILTPMYFNDFEKAEYTFLKSVELLREDAAKAKIKVYSGFEVDYFPSLNWRKKFEKLRNVLEADYYIGSCHFIKSDDEEIVSSFYYPEGTGPQLTPEFIKEAIEVRYWDNIVSAIESGYFDFIAHIDVINLFERFKQYNCQDGKWRVIEALAKHSHAYELNTSGWRKINLQHPETWMIEELNKRNVPIVVNDDAHHVCQIAENYDKAEKLLSDIGYNNFWRPSK